MTALDLVIPVHNEERVLPASVARVRDHLAALPWTWRLTIADNASTDATEAVGRRLANAHPEVRFVRVAAKGRGCALKRGWSTSDAQALAYMDVDLSTDLDAVLPLVTPVLEGRADLVVGTRLGGGARVERGLRREVISRSYNQLLHGLLRTGFSDAQCGFKAIRPEVAHGLLPLVQDDGWFFDTELLVRAQRAGLRIHEVPVAWVEDPDSRVDVVRTAIDDLRGIARLLRDRRPQLTRTVSVRTSP